LTFMAYDLPFAHDLVVRYLGEFASAYAEI
jgi:hypothetical protein